jgi:hypothetical protein
VPRQVRGLCFSSVRKLLDPPYDLARGGASYWRLRKSRSDNASAQARAAISASGITKSAAPVSDASIRWVHIRARGQAPLYDPTNPPPPLLALRDELLAGFGRRVAPKNAKGTRVAKTAKLDFKVASPFSSYFSVMHYSKNPALSLFIPDCSWASNLLSMRGPQQAQQNNKTREFRSNRCFGRGHFRRSHLGGCGFTWGLS